MIQTRGCPPPKQSPVDTKNASLSLTRVLYQQHINIKHNMLDMDCYTVPLWDKPS